MNIKSPSVLAALGASLWLAACGPSTSTAPPAPMAPAADRLQVRLRTVDDLKPVPGALTTRDIADARARISGVLTRLLVKAGDQVRQGQLIAMVKDDRIALQTGAYDAQMSAAAAQAAAAQADLARTRDLFAHGVYAQARLDQVEAQAKSANGALAQPARNAPRAPSRGRRAPSSPPRPAGFSSPTCRPARSSCPASPSPGSPPDRSWCASNCPRARPPR